MTNLLTRLKKKFGWQLRQAIRSAAHRTLRRWQHRGRARFCPVCRSHLSAFMPWGSPEPRPEVYCPVCTSHERHRLIFLYFASRPELFARPRLRLLHVAPEEALAQYFRGKPNVDYLSGDLESPDAMVHFDLTCLPFAADSFDAIYCSHVLEHIPNDRTAMAELYRILRPGGWAILQVPLDIGRYETWEDWSVQSPEARERAFGQRDHVRLYGLDYADRLRSAGFDLTVDTFVRKLPPADVQRYGLVPHEDVYFCKKPTNLGLPAGSTR